MISLEKIAENYSQRYNDALSKFITYGVIDDIHQAELEVEIRYNIEKIERYINEENNKQTTLYLKEELKKLNYLWDEIVNPSITPIMEK